MFIEYYPTSKAYKSYTLCRPEILYNTVGHMPMIMMIAMDSCGRRLFSGARIWLRMTFKFNYPVLWVWLMVRVKILGSVNSNHKHNPKQIYNHNPNPTLTLILTLTYMLTQREVLEGQTGSHRAKRVNFGRGVRGYSPGKFKKPTVQMVQSTYS